MKYILLSLISLMAAIETFAAGAGGGPITVGIQVTLLLYSGRPNPTFVVSDPSLIVKLSQKIKQAPQMNLANAQSVIPNRLGYKGVEVTNLSTSLPGFDTMQVYRSNIQLKNDATISSLGKVAPEQRSDFNSELETLLIQEALRQNIIDKKTLDYIRQ